MRCLIPKTGDMFDITDDDSFNEMFKMHKFEIVINVHVLGMDVIPNEQTNVEVDNGQNTYMNLGKKKKEMKR